MSAGFECGSTVVRSHGCLTDNCQKPFYTPNHCRSKKCPECYPWWLSDRTERILDRILSEEARSHNPGARLVEIILWWPKGWNPETKAEYDMKFKEAMTYIYDKGFLGGVAIPHPFRANAAGKKLGVVKQLTSWKAIRGEENEWLYYYTSHHLHLIGFVGFMKPPKKGEGFGYEMVMRDGYVVDFLRKSKRRSGLRPVIRYFLTHTGYFVDDPKRMESYKWVGTCSKKAFKVTEEEKAGAKSRVKLGNCPFCGGEIGSRRLADRIFHANIEAGYDPPKFKDEIDQNLRGEIPEDAGMWLVPHEKMELEE